MGDKLKITKTAGKLKPKFTYKHLKGHTPPKPKQIEQGKPPTLRTGTPFKLRGGTGNKNSYSGFQNRGLISPMQNGEGDFKKKLQEQAQKEAEQKMQQQEYNEEGKKYAEVTKTASTSRGTGTGYEEAYKKVDKTKYPTLESFIKDAESYHKSKDISVTGKAQDEIKKEEKAKSDIVPTDPVSTYVEDPGVITGFTPNPRYDPMDVKGMKAQGIVKSFPIYAPKPKRKSQKGGEGEHLDVETSDVSGVGVLGQQKHDYKKPVVGETTESANNPIQKKDPIKEMKRKSRKKKEGEIKGEGYDVLKGKF